MWVITYISHFYNEITKLPVIAIDMDNESCTNASKLLDKLNLSKSITVVNCDAQFYNYDETSLVVIANMIINLENVMEAISRKNIKHIIYRNTTGIRSMYYQNLNDNVIKLLYESIACTNPIENGFISTSFYVQ